ncbi:cytochrome b [Pseudemcibacter aquimaris]|uniref:cytochrome b n=1 Tax=Pseudemcibacter aquimaris TaxID=2857064 RepID=UPI002012DD85|nr:cytochrome b [Pseudemcibacter aquimaris]MCC3859844.1 cytochrome b [Pseudemcibacter aquimaris]WDU57176.1 cytochrome b [Pseudemcibacter aquimaris]
MKDTNKKYGPLSKLLHWVVGIGVIGLFGLGYWMRTLDYYSAWYQKAPYIHEGVGLIMLVLVPIMLIWRLKNTNPDDSHLSSFEKLSAGLMKKALYLLMAIILVTGYLISSAGDTPINFFDLFEVPAIFTVNDSKVFIGNLHQYFAYAIMGFVALHALAALKHHFIDKDDTLKRMLPFIKVK